MTHDPAAVPPPADPQPQQPQQHHAYPAASPVGYTQPPPYQQQYQPYPQAPVHFAPPPPSRGTNFGLPLVAGLVWPIGVLVLIFAVYGLPEHPEALGRLMGFMSVPWLLSALITWAIFRRRTVNFVILVLVTFPFFFLLFGFLGAARLNS
jgi:hypothetical protein